MDGMKVVITGPTGAIGIALAQEYISRNVEVLAVCRKNSNRIAGLPQSPLLHILELDMKDYGEYQPDADFTDYDIFYHFAWDGTTGADRDDMYLQHANVGYTLDAVFLAKKLGCHTFVGAGSQAEYGRTETGLNSDVPVFPENGYGMAKLCAGQMSRVLCGRIGLRHIWTRILSVYGPGDGPFSMVMQTIRKLLNGEIPQFTKGEQMWDYIYSKDAARAMLLLGERGRDGGIYCIGSGSARPLSEYIEIIRDSINPEATIMLGAIPYSDRQVMHLVADIEELQRDTGFSPETDFETGICETIKWVKDN